MNDEPYDYNARVSDKVVGGCLGLLLFLLLLFGMVFFVAWIGGGVS